MREIVVLHGVNHLIKRDVLKSHILRLSIFILIESFLFSLVILILSSINIIILIFALMTLSGIAMALIILNIHLILGETSADKFAAQIIVTNFI